MSSTTITVSLSNDDVKEWLVKKFGEGGADWRVSIETGTGTQGYGPNEHEVSYCNISASRTIT
jgi:hypothetical protein